MVELYNNLDGKNLCNIFASVIVNKINDSCVDAITEITVVNVIPIIQGQFIILFSSSLYFNKPFSKSGCCII